MRHYFFAATLPNNLHPGTPDSSGRTAPTTFMLPQSDPPSAVKPDRTAPTAAGGQPALLLALVCCTAVMVATSASPGLNPRLRLVLILGFAGIEALLVAGRLMHLLNERRTIVIVLGLTAVFFLGLLGLPILAGADHTSLLFK
jgi:FtsH-binding integral membrane protein